jgi:hypothetical protein
MDADYGPNLREIEENAGDAPSAGRLLSPLGETFRCGTDGVTRRLVSDL